MDSNDFKEKIMKILLDDLSIGQAILNNNLEDNKTILDIEPPFPLRLNMKNTSIYSYNLIPKIQNVEKNYIVMKFDFRYSNSVTIKDININMRIFTHINLQDTGLDIPRNDFIRNRIKQLLLNDLNLGIGKLMIRNERDLEPISENYVVSEITFSNSDFI